MTDLVAAVRYFTERSHDCLFADSQQQRQQRADVRAHGGGNSHSRAGAVRVQGAVGMSEYDFITLLPCLNKWIIL